MGGRSIQVNRRTQAAVIDAHGDLKRRGQEWVGECPLCGGRDRFRVQPDGRMYCRRCLPDISDPDRFRQMLAALGLNGDGRTSTNGKPAPVATYDYTTRDGTVVGYVDRLPGKTKIFKPRRPDGTRGSFGAIPYRLHSFPEFGRVVVCEGEKDVSTLAARGIAATTKPGCVALTPEFAEHFRGLDVLILPDNDKAGHDLATKMGEALKDFAESIHVLALPDLPEAGDVTDWFQSGGTVTDFEALALTAPSFEAWDPEPAPPLLVTWQEYRALAAKEPAGDYVVPGLYRRGQSSLLVGEPKSGKSTLCRRLAVQVAQGGIVLGQRVEAAPVVYLPLQEDPRHVVRELEAVGPVEGVRLWLHDPGQPMEWDRLADALQEIAAALLIVDMLADFKTWEDGNDYVEMKGVIGEFKRLARETECHTILVHHGNKTPMTSYPTARVHGSAAIAGEVDVVASIHRDPKKGRVYQAEGRGISYTEVRL